MKDLKEYGVDLEKEYNDTKSKLIRLETKILKRALLLQKQSPKTLIWNIPLSKFKYLKRYNVRDLLSIIKTVEEEYVSKSKQTVMNFNSKDK
jgi:hypothetical protein